MVETRRIWPVKNSLTVTVKQFWLSSFVLLMITNTGAGILFWQLMSKLALEKEGTIRFFFLAFVVFLFVEAYLFSLYFTRGRAKNKNERMVRTLLALIIGWNNAVFALVVLIFLFGVGLAKFDVFTVIALAFCILAVIIVSDSVKDAKSVLPRGINERISL